MLVYVTRGYHRQKRSLASGAIAHSVHKLARWRNDASAKPTRRSGPRRLPSKKKAMAGAMKLGNSWKNHGKSGLFLKK